MTADWRQVAAEVAAELAPSIKPDRIAIARRIAGAAADFAKERADQAPQPREASGRYRELQTTTSGEGGTFDRAFAEVSGVHRLTVLRFRRVGQGLTPDAEQTLRDGTRLPTFSLAARIARLPQPKQARVARRMIGDEPMTFEEACVRERVVLKPTRRPSMLVQPSTSVAGRVRGGVRRAAGVIDEELLKRSPKAVAAALVERPDDVKIARRTIWRLGEWLPQLEAALNAALEETSAQREDEHHAA